MTMSFSGGRNGAYHIHWYCPVADWLWQDLYNRERRGIACTTDVEVLLLCVYWGCVVTYFEPKKYILVTPALCSTKKTGDTCFGSRGDFPKTDPSLLILLKPSATPGAGWAGMLTLPQNGMIWSNVGEGKTHALFVDQASCVTLNSYFSCASSAHL